MPITTFFFDLDDTLYPPSSGLWDAIRRRMEHYLTERMGIAREDVPTLREKLYTTYGTTLRGLQMTRGVDTLEYLAYVHDVPLEEFITPDARIRGVLEQIPGRKLIFTNADRHHANRVLAILGLQGIFEDIIDIMDMAPYCKPERGAFEKALQRAGNPDPRTCLMLDDAPRNLATAASLGFATICVGQPTTGLDACSAQIPHLSELLTILPRMQMRAEGRDE